MRGRTATSRSAGTSRTRCPENFFLAWQRGAGSRYRDLGIRFLADDWYWDPLAAGQNVLPGKHAYSHVNAMSSAMQAYLFSATRNICAPRKTDLNFCAPRKALPPAAGDPTRISAKPGSGEIGESLTKTHSSFETPCGSYAHFKITRYLLRATKDSRYGDSMERVLYNCILGAKPHQGRRARLLLLRLQQRRIEGLSPL